MFSKRGYSGELLVTHVALSFLPMNIDQVLLQQLFQLEDLVTLWTLLSVFEFHMRVEDILSLEIPITQLTIEVQLLEMLWMFLFDVLLQLRLETKLLVTTLVIAFQRMLSLYMQS